MLNLLSLNFLYQTIDLFFALVSFTVCCVQKSCKVAKDDLRHTDAGGKQLMLAIYNNIVSAYQLKQFNSLPELSGR